MSRWNLAHAQRPADFNSFWKDLRKEKSQFKACFSCTTFSRTVAMDVTCNKRHNKKPFNHALKIIIIVITISSKTRLRKRDAGPFDHCFLPEYSSSDPQDLQLISETRLPIKVLTATGRVFHCQQRSIAHKHYR